MDKGMTFEKTIVWAIILMLGGVINAISISKKPDSWQEVFGVWLPWGCALYFAATMEG